MFNQKFCQSVLSSCGCSLEQSFYQEITTFTIQLLNHTLSKSEFVDISNNRPLKLFTTTASILSKFSKKKIRTIFVLKLFQNNQQQKREKKNANFNGTIQNVRIFRVSTFCTVPLKLLWSLTICIFGSCFRAQTN